MTVKVDCASFEFVKAVGIWHLYAEALFESDVFDLAHKVFSKVGFVNNLVVVEGVERQASDNFAEV